MWLVKLQHSVINGLYEVTFDYCYAVNTAYNKGISTVKLHLMLPLLLQVSFHLLIVESFGMLQGLDSYGTNLCSVSLILHKVAQTMKAIDKTDIWVSKISGHG